MTISDQRPRYNLPILLGVIMASSMAPTLTRGEQIWTNASGNNLWNTAQNWSTNSVPQNNGVTIGQSTSGFTIIVDKPPQNYYGGTNPIGWITFNTPNSYTINGGTLLVEVINTTNHSASQYINSDIRPYWGNNLQIWSGDLKSPIYIGGSILDNSNSLTNSSQTNFEGAGVVLSGYNSYTGITTSELNMVVTGPAGYIGNSQLINLNGSSLTLDNTKGNGMLNRLGDAPVVSFSGTIRQLGAATDNSYTHISSLTLDASYNRLEGNAGIDQHDPTNPVSYGSTMVVGTLIRAHHATLAVNNQFADPLNPTASSVLVVENAPATVGGNGSSDSPQLKILPWAINADHSFMTYDVNTHQLRGLNLNSEYASLPQAGPTDNTQVATASVLAANRTINSLLIQPNAPLQLTNGTQLTITSGAISLASSGISIDGDTGSQVHFGDTEGMIHLFTDTQIAVPLVGTAGLTVSGGHQLTLGVPNPNLSGGININASQLSVPVSGALGTGPINFYGSNTDSYGSLHITNTLSFANDINIYQGLPSSDTSHMIFSSVLYVDENRTATHTGGFMGSGGVYKYGKGTWVAKGHSSVQDQLYFNINEGALEFDGTIEGTNPYALQLSVSTSGRLTGTGNIQGIVDADDNGVISPGQMNTPGILTVGALHIRPGGHLEFLLAGSTSGTGYSQIAIQTIDDFISEMAMFDDSYLDLNLQYAPTYGQVFKLIDLAGEYPINGTFLYLPEGGIYNTTFNGAEYSFRASYLGGDGNDFTLTSLTVTVPEPASLSLLVLSAGFLLRRRK